MLEGMRPLSRALELGSLVALPLATAFAFAAACQAEQAAPPTVSSGGGGHAGGGGGGGDDSGVSPTFDGGPGGTVLAYAFAPQAIVLDSANVYWTTTKGLANPLGGIGDASAGTGAVDTVPRAGGTVSQVMNGLSNPSSLAIAGETIFLADGTGPSGLLRVYPLSTTTSTSVALDQFAPFPMVVNSNSSTLFWVTGTGAQLNARALPTDNPVASAVTQLGSNANPYQPIAVTVLGASLFVLASDGANAAVLSVPATGQPTILWKQASVTAADLTSFGDTLYFALGNTLTSGGEILELPAGGGTAITLASGQQNPAKIAVVDTVVYFTSNVASGAVLSVGTGGGNVATLASGLSYPSPLAVDDAIYVGTATAVVAVPK